MIKVLYLSYDGLTDPLGQSQILPYLCGLSAQYNITIVSFEKEERFVSNRESIQRLCDTNRIIWIPLCYHKKPPVFSTVYDLWRLKREVISLHKRDKFSIVHCRSYITSLVGLWMKHKFKIKFIFDMRGFWADERVEGNLWNLKNPFYKKIYSFFKKNEMEFFQQSDSVISLTDAAKEYVIKEFNISSEKITVIPCSVDQDLFNTDGITENQKNALREELGLSINDFVLLYLGSLGTWYMYDEMVSFFNELKKYKPNAKFLFLTPDKNKVHLREDFITRTVVRNEVPLYCSVANASIFFIRPSFSKMASSATKMAEVMAMGLTVITNPGWGDVASMSEQGVKILLYDVGPIPDISQTKIESENNKTHVYSKMSLKAAVSKYLSVYQSLIN
jgi:glycosyltransferase involved in cell wall biosynthesis